MIKSKLNLMAHELYTIRFYGPWKSHKSQKLTSPGFNGSCKYVFMAMNEWMQIKLLETLGNWNINGYDAETCDKTGKTMLL